MNLRSWENNHHRLCFIYQFTFMRKCCNSSFLISSPFMILHSWENDIIFYLLYLHRRLWINIHEKMISSFMFYIYTAVYKFTFMRKKYIEDIYFFKVNTKYISSRVLKSSEFSRVHSTSENFDVWHTFGIYCKFSFSFLLFRRFSVQLTMLQAKSQNKRRKRSICDRISGSFHGHRHLQIK